MSDATSAARSMQLGYATNVFRSETLAEVIATLQGPLARIRRFLSGSFQGFELRLGMAATEEAVRDPGARERLIETLKGNDLPVLTINGFSPQDFHGRRVKEEAYRPTWLEEGRLLYTKRLAELLAELLPEGRSGAISTSPGSFKAFGHDAERLDATAEAFAAMASFLFEIEERTGRRISLCIEPEPGCTIESTDEAIVFFDRHLLGAGARYLRKRGALSGPKAEEVLRRHLAVTFDCCHLSIEFEDLVDSARRLAESGVSIGKVHATSAIRLERPAERPEGLAKLARYARSPYLHQVIGTDGGGRVVFRAQDLEPALAAPEELLACAEIRIHFHLPLFVEKIGPLGTTVPDTVAGVRYIAERALCPVAILETYTWSVLSETGDFAGLDVESGIAREIRWARESLF